MEKIVIIDYGMGNLRSVSKAWEKIGTKVEITNSIHKIDNASCLVLPGVGAFSQGMENLRKLNLTSAIYEAILKNKPFLGICLGLQLLFTQSQEHGCFHGLNIIKGKVNRFDTTLMKIPHMGWNQVEYKTKTRIFEGIPNKGYFYFVHSYYVEPEDENLIVATTEYGGKEFASVIRKNNIWGVQFHPEKSANLGLKLLENFYRYYIVKC